MGQTWSHDPSVVEVPVRSGCGPPMMEEGYVDPRLVGPLVTIQEWQEKCRQWNEYNQQKSVCSPHQIWKYAGPFLVGLVTFIILMVIFFEDPTMECDDPNGCEYWCCDPASSLARVIETADAGQIFSDNMCTMISETKKDECEGCGRLARPNEQPKTEEPQCETHIQGAGHRDPGVGWPAALCLLFIIPFGVFITMHCVLVCNVGGYTSSLFADWSSRGIQSWFVHGSKHRRAKMCFRLPPMAPMQPMIVMTQPMAAMQPMMQQQPPTGMATGGQFQVQVPPNMGPGMQMQVKSPQGMDMMVQIPAGCAAGSVFLVQGPPQMGAYSAAPAQQAEQGAVHL